MFVIKKLKNSIRIQYICEIFDGINRHLNFRILLLQLMITITTSKS